MSEPRPVARMLPYEEAYQAESAVSTDSEEAPGSGVHRDGASWPVLSDSALYGLAGEVVATLLPHTEADRAALLVSFLVAFGNSVNAGPHALADGACHPARLFAVVVGDTARSRKGTSWRQVRRIFEVADPDWLKLRSLGGLSSGEGLIAAVADAATDKSGAPTGGVSDKRCLVVEEEFARVLTAARRDGSTLSPLVRQAWDTGSLRSMTKVPLAATGAHVSILGHTTVEELRAKLTETDQANGLANRFLFVCARRSKLLPSGGSLDDAEMRRLGRLVSHALVEARRIGTLARTVEAERRWADLYERMATGESGQLVGAVTARAEAQVLRLSVAFALTDAQALIDVRHLDAAWALWRYCETSALHIFGSALGDDVADKLLAALRRASPDGLDGTQQRDLFGRHESGGRLARARELLELHRLAHTVEEETSGRSRLVTFAIVDATEATKATEA